MRKRVRKEKGRGSRGKEDRKEGEGGQGGQGREGKVGRGEGRRELAIHYLLRLPAPPAPPSLGTFCCGPSTSYA